MTVGITLSNGLEAIVITDSRASGLMGRQSDSVNKMGEFSKDNYAGVIFGSGSGNLIEEILRNLDSIPGEQLEEFVAEVHKRHKSSIDRFSNSYLQAQREEIYRKASMIQDEAEQKQFIQQQTGMVLQQYDQMKQDPSHRTEFVLTAFDKKAKKVRIFYIDANQTGEYSSDHIEIGSGSDGANLYFATKLQGIDARKLNAADMAFFVTNAYSLSTVNLGVGGTPKIAKISEDGSEVLDPEKTRVLGNLSGGYLSEFNQDLTAQKTREHFKAILDSNQRPDYEPVTKLLDLNTNTLTTTYIPLSSWQDRANSQHFKPIEPAPTK